MTFCFWETVGWDVVSFVVVIAFRLIRGLITWADFDGDGVPGRDFLVVLWEWEISSSSELEPEEEEELVWERRLLYFLEDGCRKPSVSIPSSDRYRSFSSGEPAWEIGSKSWLPLGGGGSFKKALAVLLVTLLGAFLGWFPDSSLVAIESFERPSLEQSLAFFDISTMSLISSPFSNLWESWSRKSMLFALSLLFALCLFFLVILGVQWGFSEDI